jgi:hypothetical protein
MDGTQALAGEALVAMGVIAWRNIKGSYAPLPNELVMSGISFGVIGVISYASPELAAIIGAGFLVALLIKEFKNPANVDAYQGPKGYSHDNLIMLGPPKTNVPGAVG